MKINPNNGSDQNRIEDRGRASSSPIPQKESLVARAIKIPIGAVSDFFAGSSLRRRSESSPAVLAKSFSKQSTFELNNFMKDYEQKIKESPQRVSKEVVRQWLASYEAACKNEGKEQEFYGFASVPIDVQIALLETTPKADLVQDFPEMATNFKNEFSLGEGALYALHNRFRQDFSRSITGMHFYVSENSPFREELTVSSINPSWVSLLDVQVAGETLGGLLIAEESVLNTPDILGACRKFCKEEDSSEYPAAFRLQSASDPEALLRDPDFRKKLLGEVTSKMEKALPAMQEVAGNRISYRTKINECIGVINRLRIAMGEDLREQLPNLGERKIRQQLNSFGLVERSRSPNSVVETGIEGTQEAGITIGEELAHQVLAATQYATKEEQILLLQTFQITHFSLPMADLQTAFAGRDPPVIVRTDEKFPLEFAIHHQGEDLFVKANCKMHVVDSDTEGVIKNFNVNMIFDVRNQLLTYRLQERLV